MTHTLSKSSTEWVAGFDYPPEHWIQLDMKSPDVAEQAAQAIADRGGEIDQEYAEGAYPELKAIRDGALEREASPVVVFVPPEAPDLRPLVQITAFVAPVPAPSGHRTVEAMAELARQPQPYRFRQPGISVIDLPAGPTCRVHELVHNEPGDDGRNMLTEYISYYVLPPGYDKGFVEFTVTWFTPAIGSAMVETADEMAATLTITPNESPGGES
ncbi:hypothetical protein [Streptomyces litchfieldiae]|uniref:Uncharacterized protein n=1 Tax=Streptomyces litchfieldiae TaxID=3075543 RepID=A0ABU2MJU6_9ACTN|nr:hypothetical protein [Streptomyces sp. DSM 44938]MDT0341760.1 hypothetical protein [Streptomyces sp. DSM 44938]